MSLPKELRDQLLSGYLDDALSADERARVEQLLQSDPETRDELSQLRNLRRSLKAVAQADSDIRLDAGFADRVLGAAVARARSEGCDDDHPLVRLSAHPITPARAAGDSSSWRYAGVLVALAASIVIAVVALRPQPAQDPGLALAPETQPTPPDSPLDVPSVMSEAPKLADSDTDGPVVPDKGDLEMQPETAPSTVEQLESPPQPTDAIVRSDVRPAKESIEPPAESKIDVPNTGSGAILVLNVRRTPAGRQSRAVAKALESANLDAANEKAITDEIVGLVKETQQSPDKEFSVLYLQAPAKNLDRFYLRLLEDQEGIESVRWTLAMDAPIMKMVRTLRSDPTLIRHDASLLLTSEDGYIDELAGRLGELGYQPLNRELVGAIPTKGPDITSQILVLVR